MLRKCVYLMRRFGCSLYVWYWLKVSLLFVFCRRYVMNYVLLVIGLSVCRCVWMICIVLGCCCVIVVFFWVYMFWWLFLRVVSVWLSWCVINVGCWMCWFVMMCFIWVFIMCVVIVLVGIGSLCLVIDMVLWWCSCFMSMFCVMYLNIVCWYLVSVCRMWFWNFVCSLYVICWWFVCGWNGMGWKVGCCCLWWLLMNCWWW